MKVSTKKIVTSRKAHTVLRDDKGTWAKQHETFKARQSYGKMKKAIADAESMEISKVVI